MLSEEFAELGETGAVTRSIEVKPWEVRRDWCQLYPPSGIQAATHLGDLAGRGAGHKTNRSGF